MADVTKRDYITASSQLVNTGADLGLISGIIKTPEAKMLDLQRESNAMAAKSLENQQHFARAAYVMHGEMQSTHTDMNQGFSNVVESADRVNESINRGLSQVDNTLHSVGNKLDSGFINVCRGLFAVDSHLVEGFTGTIGSINNQTSVLDNRLAEVGNAMINNMNIQHQLDRETLVQVGRHIVDVFKQEGEATRETIVKAANATIETLENQGMLNRQEIQNMGEFIGKNIYKLEQAMIMTMKAHSELMGKKMDDISDKLTRPGEIQAREHTRSALNFFRDELYDDALRALELANNSFYGYFPALYLKGVINMILDNLDISRKSLLAALSQAGAVDVKKQIYEKTLALLMLGRIEIIEENWSKADETFGKLGDMNPDFVIAWIEQAYAIFRNEKRGSIEDRSAMILKGLDKLKMKSSLGWYGFALQIASEFPREAVDALKRGIAIHRQILEKMRVVYDNKYLSLAVFKLLNELYPGKVPYLYAAVLIYAHEFKWIVE